jgi:protein SCO1/2
MESPVDRADGGGAWRKAAGVLFVLGAGLLAYAFAVRAGGRGTPGEATIQGVPVSRLPALPHMRKIPEFDFEECRGGRVSRADLAGKVLVVDFFFTSCNGPCPLMEPYIKGIHKERRDDDRVRVVSFTVDPERDTPEVLRAHAEKVAATDRWHFLRSTKEEVLRVAYEGFGLGDDKDPIAHSNRFVLVDREGWIRGYYDGTDGRQVSLLHADLDRVLAEGAQ